MAVKAGDAYVQLTMRGGEPLKRSMATAGNSLGKFTALAKKASIALGGAFAAKKIVEWGAASIRAFTESSKEITKFANEIGVAADKFASLEYGLRVSGLGLDVLADGIKTLVKSGEFKGNPLEQLMMAADEIAGLNSPLERSARAVELFGEKGAALLPFLEKGSQGIRSLQREATGLGLALDEDMLQNATALQESWGRLAAVGTALFRKIGSYLAPVAKFFTDITVAALKLVMRVLPSLEWAFDKAIVQPFKFLASVYDKYKDIINNLFGVGPSRSPSSIAFERAASARGGDTKNLEAIQKQQLAEQRALNDHIRRNRIAFGA